MTRILPIACDTPIPGPEAYPLTILGCRRTYLPWFCSRHIQLFWREGEYFEGPSGLDFYRQPMSREKPCALLEVCWVPASAECNRGSEAISWVRDHIGRWTYVRLRVDGLCLPEGPVCGHRAGFADVLVYGCGENPGMLHAVECTPDARFVPTAIPFQAFEAGVAIGMAECPEQVGLFRYRTNETVDLDIQLICDLLVDYLYSRNTSERLRMVEAPIRGTFGLATYLELIGFCRGLHPGPGSYRALPFQVLEAHKRCMLARLRFLRDNGVSGDWDDIVQTYADVARQSSLLRVAAARLGATGETKAMDGAEKVLEAMARKEAGILMRVLAMLQR